MGYAYQYETSPRKLKPEYDTPKKKKQPTKATTKKKTTTAKTKKTKEKAKAKEKDVAIARANFTMLMIIALGCILLIMYRNVKINEAFTQVQALSKTVSNLEKENSQISVSIQNNLNLSNIESTASSVLGMQKLSSKQTFYINLDTKDYVEVTTPTVKVEEKTNFFENIFNKIKSFF